MSGDDFGSIPTPLRRRDAPAEQAAQPASLPAASPVARVRSRVARWTRTQKTLAVGSTVVGVGLIITGLITSGGGGVPRVDGPVTTYADSVQADGTTVSTGERVSVPRPDDADSAADPTSPDTDRTPTDTQTDAQTPGTSPPGADPGPSNPGTGNPAPSNPGPSDPGTGPLPTTPPVVPPVVPPAVPPVVPAVPQALGFGGLQANFITVLGIRLLGSYTLSLSGQPGATASVSYGSRDNGTVTFDASGYASTTFGRALVDLGLSNPIIRIAYSDGTAGSAIERARDSL